ncbi:SdrD B-like domain-containing protein [Spirosoma pulveris]
MPKGRLLLGLSVLIWAICGVSTTKAQNAPLGCDKYKLLISENDNSGSYTMAFDFPTAGTTPSCNLGPGSGGENIVIDPTKNLAYICPLGSVNIKVYDFATGQFKPDIPVPSETGYLASATLSADNNYLFVTGRDALYKVNLATNAIEAELTLPGQAGSNNNLWGLAVNPNNSSQLYFSARWNPVAPSTVTPSIWFTDPNLGTPTLAYTLPSGLYPRGITFASDGTMWATTASTSGPDQLLHLSVNANGTLSQIASFPFPPAISNTSGTTNDPFGIVTGPDGNLYLVTFYGACVYQVTPSGTFNNYIPNTTGALAKGIAFICGNYKCPCTVSAGVGSSPASTCGSASINITGATGNQANINVGSTYGTLPKYNDPSNKAISSGGVTFSGLLPNTTYTVRVWNGSDDCYADVTITTTGAPVPNPPVSGGDKTVCQGAPLPALSVQVGGGETANWYNSAGTLVASSLTTYTPTAAGTYLVETFNPSTGCKSATRTSVSLTLNPPPAINPIPAKVICDGTSVQLNATASIPGSTYAWSGGPLTSLTIANPIASPAGSLQENKLYSYVVVVTTPIGCTASATAQITVTPSIRVFAGSDMTICEKSSTPLSATTNLQSSAINGTVSVAWSEVATNPSAGNNLASTTGYTVATKALAPGVYKFTATVTQVSPDGLTNCVNTDEVQVTVMQAPVLTIKPTRDNICSDNTMTVTLASTLSTAAPANVTWTSTDDPTLAYLSCTNCANPVLTLPASYNKATITYTANAVVTADNNIQCTASASVTIAVKKEPVLIVSPPKIICDGTSVQLNVDSDKTAATYEWTGSALSSLSIKNPIVAPAGSLQEDKTYLYTVKVTDTDGCFTSAITSVTVTPSIRVYAGEDATICEKTTTPLSATTNLQSSAVNGTITVAWTEDPSNLNKGSNLASTAGYNVNTNALAPGVYKFWATVTQKSPDGLTNCINTDWVQITVTRNPVLVIVPTQPNICPLSQETITLAANLSGGTPAAASIYWTSKDDPTAKFLSCSVCANPTLTVPAGYTGATISYTATAIVTADNNIQCPTTATVTIIVNPLLKVDVIADVTVCNEYIAVKQQRSTTLRELVSGNPVNIAQWKIEPMVGITNVVVSGATLTFDVLPSNEIVEYTVTLNSAETCYASTKFFGYENPRPIVEFTMDSYVCLGSKTQVLFNGNAKPGAIYTWDFAGAKVIYSNDSKPYDGIAEGPGPHDIQWDKYPGFGNTYVVSLTVNDGGCTDTRRKDIRIERGYDVVWNTTNTSVCNGTDGKITLVSAREKVTNRDVTNTLVFTWTGPNGFTLVAAAPQGSNLTNLAPGTYHVRVDNSIGGCAYEYDLDIKRPKNLGLNALVGYKATCGKTDGGIHTEVVGGTAPYTFFYYDAAGALLSQKTVNDTLDYKWGLAEGKYHVKVVDVNKCSTEGDIVLDNVGGPRVEIAQITPTPCGDKTGKVQFTIFGAAPFSYSLASDNPYSGGTITQAGIPVTLEFLEAGDYVMTVRDANGCVTVKRFTVGALASGFNIAVTTTPGSCPYNPNGSENPKTGAFQVTSPLGAQYTYTWIGMDGKVFTPTSPTNPTGLATGIYKLKISSNTAGGGVCTDSTTLILNPSEGPKPELVTIKNPTCPDLDNGSVTFIVNKNLDSGTPDKNRFPLTNIGPYSYTLRNTTSQDGFVISGMVIDNTNLTVYGLARGTYLLTITDCNLCVGYQTFQVTDPEHFEVLVDRNNLVLCDAKDGKVCLTINGATGQQYTVSVSPTAINPTPFTRNVTNCLFGMDANKEYIVTIRDAQNCYVNFPVSLTQPAVCFDCDKFCSKDVEGYDMSCDSLNTGKARIRVTGGKAPFKYTWYNSLGQVVSQVTSADSVNTIDKLTAGVYYISVVDANSCTIGGSDGGKQKISVAIGQSGGPTVVINSTTSSACGASTGAIRFSVTGNKPFTYTLTKVGSSVELATGSILNVPNAITLSNLLAASYVLKVKDSKGCVTTTLVDIRSSTFPMVISSTLKKPSCDGVTLGEIAISLSPLAGQTAPGGSPTYVWSGPNGVFTPAIPEKATMLPAGIYHVTVSYSNGCSDTEEIILNNADGPTLSATPTGLVTCIGANNGSITLNANGNGQAIIGYIVKGVLSKPYSAPYPTSITNEVIANLAAGDYEIEVIGFNGCVSKAMVTVQKPEVPIIDIQTTAVNDCDINNGTATISVVSGGKTPFQIRLVSPTATAFTAGPITYGSLAGGDYVAEAKDANGCLTQFPFTVADLRKQLCYGTIGDFVWKDRNDNGKQDTGEPGVAGVTVELWKAVNGTPSTKITSATTTATGKYLFTELLKGDYIVRFVKGTWPDSCAITPKYKQAGVLDSLNSDADPTSGLSPVVSLDPIKGGLLKNNPTIDLGLYVPTSTLGDFVWKDKNDNGIQDASEVGVKGVKVVLWSATTGGTPGTKLDSTTTDATGKYGFINLKKGDYIVQFVPSSLPDSCALSKKPNLSSIGDEFDSDADPITGITQVVSLDPYQTGLLKNNPTIDAGLAYPKGSIGDYVWKDANDNGIQDAGEAGVANVLVELYKVVNGQRVLPSFATQTTDINGRYLFPNLDTGDYQVKFVGSTLPVGCAISQKPNTGNDDTKDSDADPTSGLSPVIPINPYKGPGLLRDNLTVDAGLYTPAVGSIGDYVWKDTNDNGIQDAGEAGVKDVQVELYKAVNGQPQGAALKIVSTDVTGKYLFDQLPKGDYLVKFVSSSFPASCAISTRPNTGNDDTKDSDADPTTGLSQVVTLDPVQGGILKDNPTIDAGLYNTATGSIGDYVWKDANDNGIQDAGEAGVANVQVELYAAVNGQPQGAALKVASTDANGKYLFDKLPKGTYLVRFIGSSFPANCAISTRPRSGTDTGKDSDADPTSGLSQVVTLDPIQGGILKDNLTIDAGLYNVSVPVFTVTSATVCYGSQTTLTATGCTGTVRWNTGTTGNTLITPALTTTTSYTATCSAANNVVSAVGTVTVVPQPTVSLQASSTLVTVGSSVVLTASGCTGNLSWSTGATGSAITVTPMNPTNTYSATCTTAQGCVATASITVQTQPAPTLVVTSATICSGSSATLVASGCPVEMSWSNGTTGNTLITPALTATTSYTAICNTVDRIVSAIGTVTVLPVTPITITASSLTITNASAVTLTASGCTTGNLKWSAGGQTSAMIVVQPTQATTFYSVSCTNGSGCTSQGSITIYRVDVPQPKLELEKLVDKSRAQVNDVLTYKLIIRNTGQGTANSIVVRDSLDAGLLYVSSQASSGSFSPASFGGVWQIPALTAGSSATLTMTARVLTGGVLYNIATIPGDTNRVCTTIPMDLCEGEQIIASAPGGRSDLIWFRDGVQVGTGAQLTITRTGLYTVRTTSGTCPNSQCCPLEVVASTNCCPAKICVPFVVKQSKRAKRVGDPR